MGIAFSSARWEELKENTRAWWAGELKQPLIQAGGPRDPGRPAPALPRHQYLSFYGLDTTADRILDRIEYDHWPEVYRKIRDAGKKIQMFGDLRTLDAVAGQLGSAEGIALIASGDYRAGDIEQFMEKWG